jgi:hypothetical protein
VAPRAYWKGYLKLSLVSCPVALFPASSEREKISFNQINKKTGAAFSCQVSRRQSGSPNLNELSYASFKATEATAPKTAEASTASSRPIGGTRFSAGARGSKKAPRAGLQLPLRPTRRSAPSRTTTMPASGAPVTRFFGRSTNRPGDHRDSSRSSQHSSAGWPSKCHNALCLHAIKS